MDKPPYPPCTGNEYGWHDLHAGLMVSPGDKAIAHCRDCDQVIGPDGEVIADILEWRRNNG